MMNILGGIIFGRDGSRYTKRCILKANRFIDHEIRVFPFIEGYKISYKFLEMFPKRIKMGIENIFPKIKGELEGLEEELIQKSESQRQEYLIEISNTLKERSEGCVHELGSFYEDLGKKLMKLSEEVKRF